MSLWRLSVADLTKKTKAGEVSAVELTELFRDRVSALDDSLGAFLDPMASQALERARHLDALPPEKRGALHGLPVAVKDIISVAGSKCTCGSRALENYVPVFDATVIDRLYGAGAIVFGKTNMDEFAMGSSTENSGFHPTRNPWDTSRVPGGSSGGSAAAVAARLVPAALGTDTGGSIRQPAALCGVTGLKPTYGRVSRYGMIAFASSLDQAGPMAASAEDVAIVLEAIAGHDPKDATSSRRAVPAYSKALDTDLRKLRVGVPRSATNTGVDPDVAASFSRFVATLAKLGVEIEEVELPATEHAVSCYYLLATAEASSNLSRYDGVRYGLRVAGDQDLNTMMRRSRSEGFGSEVKRRILLGTFVLSAGYYDAYYQKAQRVRTLLARDFDDAFTEVDAIALPTTPTPAFSIGEKSEDPLSMYLSDIFTITANLIGAPALSVPAGFSESGLPVGAQLIGKHFDEATILALGHGFQSSSDFHRELPDLARV